MKHSLNGMAEKLRALLSEKKTIEMPGCHDVLSGMILQEVGFQVAFMSGYGVATSSLGNPDIGLTTLTETAAAARSLVQSLHIPVIVDIDDGYGNENNVLRTIHEMEHAGVAGIVMEDQVSPKRCGHSDNKKIIPLNEYMKKLEYVLNARKTPLCVVARTDEIDLKAAINRAKAFHAAGADVTLIDGLRSLDDVKRIADEVPGHKQINLIYGGKTPLLSLQELTDLGFKIVLYSTPTLYVVAHSLFKWMSVLRDTHDLKSISEESLTFPEFQAFIEKKYLSRNNIEPGLSKPKLALLNSK